ncbi:MAG: C1 family peptidase [Syntrophorhabdales bacterium]|jgi:C1A family cysteine protease
MIKKLVLLFGILFFLCPGAYAQTDDLSYIKAAVRAKAGKWIAGDTSVSKLSHERKLMRVALIKPSAASEPTLHASAAPLTLGTALDWRNVSGNSYVTGVRDQGDCGSCWAFATTASLESWTDIKQSTPGYDLNLAEQILVSCSGAGSCAGGSIESASNFIVTTGLPLQSAYPYTATDGTCSNAKPKWQVSDYHMPSWSYVATTSPTVDAIKNALATYGPLVTTMAVYEDFFSYVSGVYSYATGTLAGYHAVQIVGYDDVAECFICKNSWGTGWGEAGFFQIAYTELTSVVQFGEYTLAYLGSLPGSSPTNCTYSISPTSANFSHTGGSGSISVTASANNCAWTAAAVQSWIEITDGATGTGSGTISYTAAANGTTSQRSGSISAAGQTFTVQQKAQNIPKGGGEK